jgi:hypothetical protein
MSALVSAGSRSRRPPRLTSRTSTGNPGDGSVLAAYAAVTGVTPRAGLLELYRVRWNLADVAIDVSRFRRPHEGTAEDDKAFELLRSVIEELSSEEYS